MQARLGFRRRRNKNLKLRPIDVLQKIEAEGLGQSASLRKHPTKEKKKTKHSTKGLKTSEDKKPKATKVPSREGSPPPPAPPPPAPPQDIAPTKLQAAPPPFDHFPPPPSLLADPSPRSATPEVVQEDMNTTMNTFQKVTDATVGSVISNALDDEAEMSVAEMSVDSLASDVLGKTPQNKGRHEGSADIFVLEEESAATAEEDKAALRIQSLHRGNTQRELVQKKKKAEAKAATQIQSRHRGNRERHVVRDKKNTQEKAATLIQSQHRGNAERKIVQEKRNAEASAAAVPSSARGLYDLRPSVGTWLHRPTARRRALHGL